MSKLLLYMIIPFLSCCGKKEKQQDPKQVVKLAIQSPVNSLNPLILASGICDQVVRMLYEGLMRLDLEGKIIPGVAESFTISEDQKTYTFTLRDSYWSNGDPVTAYDFEYAWKKSINPLYPSPRAYLFYAIKNAEACMQKKVSVDDVGIVALDEKTLKVELEHPAPSFLSFCVDSTSAPIHKEIDLKHPQWGNDMNENLVTNGPFSIKKWKKDVEIYVEKNPSYWDSRCVKIDGIQIAIVPDSNTQFLLYEKGEIDFVGLALNTLPLDVLENLYKKGDLQVIDTYGLLLFTVNTEKPPFNNKNLRKAISYAIDRQTLADYVFPLGEEPATGVVSVNDALSDKPYFEDGNVALAKKHLDQALLELGTTLENLPIITLTLSQSSSSTIAQAIQQQIHTNLGLHIEIDRADHLVHLDRVLKGNYKMGYLKLQYPLNDPIHPLNVYRYRSSKVNFPRWEHPTYQELVKKAENEIDSEKRKDYMYRAEELLMEEMPVIPICFNKSYFMCNKHLKGLHIPPSGNIDFRYAYFE